GQGALYRTCPSRRARAHARKPPLRGAADGRADPAQIAMHVGDRRQGETRPRCRHPVHADRQARWLVMTTAADAQAARALARQKARATGLVALCALVYVVAKAFEARQPGIAYVAAFAEAAIIGGLADWYAVTALFRHPLGLKLPHTAIIPANQARIAEAIGDFIAKHFLVGARVGAKVFEADPAASAGRWLAEPRNRNEMAAHAARLVPDAIAAIDRETLGGEIERGVLERLAALDLGKVIGTSLEVITRNQRHHAILDQVLGRLESRLAEPAAL